MKKLNEHLKINEHSEKVMSTELVVKSNRIITALQNLSLIEIRLMQLAIVDARETEKGLDVNEPLSISAQRYADAFDVTLNCAYKVLADAGTSLRARYFTFLDATGSKIVTNWVQQVRYVETEGRIEIIFTVAVVNEITRLSKHFTKYTLQSISTLQSIYSVRLYELISEFSSIKKSKTLDYQIFRRQLGIADDEYAKMGDFKKRVLDLAVNEINEQTDIKVTYDQIKNGRTITAFKFTATKKRKKADNTNNMRDVNTIDMFTNVEKSEKEIKQLTDNQVSFFAAKFAIDDSFNAYEKGLKANIGESSNDYLSRVKRELSKYDNQIKWSYYLKKHGFKA